MLYEVITEQNPLQHRHTGCSRITTGIGKGKQGGQIGAITDMGHIASSAKVALIFVIGGEVQRLAAIDKMAASNQLRQLGLAIEPRDQ